jgi:RND family efflux transporter MFP subunit
MKKIIITIVTIVIAGTAIAMVLSNNKKANQAKIEFVNSGSGAAAVKVTTVARQTINLNFQANGTLAANQDLKLVSENSGRVTTIKVKEGDRVSAGQVLTTIDSKFLSLEVEKAVDAYEKLKIDQQRYSNSYETGGVTKAQLDEIDLQLRAAKLRMEEAKRKANDALVKAPISGIINKKYIEVGSYVSPGTPLFDIVDVSSLKLNVLVNEQQVSQLNVGDKVSIVIPVFPDQDFTGSISFIAAKADNGLNFPVEIKMNNQKATVRAGMYGTAKFASNESVTGIIVPRSAFVGSVANNMVYVLDGDVAKIRTVTAGRIFGETVEVLAGLNEGEIVVTAGQINLIDGSVVAVQQ